MPANLQDPSVVAEPAHAGDMEQSLCRSCGFCCDGTLFSSVSLCDLDPVTPLVAAGIRIVAHDAKRSFTQPCVAHDGQSCKVYADRPSNCREFRCKLLADHESGAVDRPQALARVRQVFALRKDAREELQRVDPALVGCSLSELRKRWASADDAAESLALRRKHGAALICMVALAWYLERHFFSNNAAEDRSSEFSEKRSNTAARQTARE